jgi:hypothetical protein
LGEAGNSSIFAWTIFFDYASVRSGFAGKAGDNTLNFSSKIAQNFGDSLV